jgi:hypothetical protein
MNLGLCFLKSGGRSERLGYGLAIHFPNEAQLRIVPRIVGLGTVTSELSTAASNHANRAWTEIGEAGDLTRDVGAFAF